MTGNEECFEKWQNPKRIRDLFHATTPCMDSNLCKNCFIYKKFL